MGDLWFRIQEYTTSLNQEFWTLFHGVCRAMGRFGLVEWGMVFVGVVGLGWLALRGFGSRSTY